MFATTEKKTTKTFLGRSAKGAGKRIPLLPKVRIGKSPRQQLKTFGADLKSCMEKAVSESRK